MCNHTLYSGSTRTTFTTVNVLSVLGVLYVLVVMYVLDITYVLHAIPTYAYVVVTRKNYI